MAKSSRVQPAPWASDATVDPAAPRGFAWQAYLTLERADDERESLRLFYVAATRARDALAECFPGRDILQIDALHIVEGGGGIHCITQQEPQ